MTFPLTPWNRPGESGRLAPTRDGWPLTGSVAFVLGSDVPGRVERLQEGDFVEAVAVGDLFTDDPALFRARLGVRFPESASSLPDDLVWRVSVFLDGVERWFLDLSGPWERSFDNKDIALPLLGIVLLTRSVVTIRLTLTGTGGEEDGYEVELPGVYLDSCIVEASS